MPITEIEAKFQINNELLESVSLGGHERIWVAFNWFTCLKEFTAIRVMAPPFAPNHIWWRSNVDRSLFKPFVALGEDEQQAVSATRDMASDTEGYVLTTKTCGGKVTGGLKGKTTEFTLESVSPGTQRRWRFTVENVVMELEVNARRGIGATGYSAKIVGGEVGGRTLSGTAYVELLAFPEDSIILKGNYIDEVSSGR